MTSISEIFRAALNEALKEQWGGQTNLAQSTGFSLSKIHSLMTGARSCSEDDHRVIAEKLGYPGRRYEDFLDIGRRALGLPVSRKGNPPSPDVAGYLDKARAILEAGGQDAEVLKRMLGLMQPKR